jgi:hypothetical protein
LDVLLFFNSFAATLATSSNKKIIEQTFCFMGPIDFDMGDWTEVGDLTWTEWKKIKGRLGIWRSGRTNTGQQ